MSGQHFRPRQRRVGIEEGRVVQFEHGEVNARRDELDRRGNFVAGLIGLHLHLAGVEHHMGARENPFALDDDAAAGDIARRFLGPGPVKIRIAHGGKHLHDRVRHRVGSGCPGPGHGGGSGRHLRRGRGDGDGEHDKIESQQQGGDRMTAGRIQVHVGQRQRQLSPKAKSIFRRYARAGQAILPEIMLAIRHFVTMLRLP